MARRKVLCIVGTRPEVIKMAPLIRVLRLDAAIELSVVCSGQHRDMLAPLCEWFELAFDEDLGVMSNNQSLGGLTSRLMAVFDSYLGTMQPDLVLGQGDTTTVMCAALACFYRRIAFGHVEAGLRTFDPQYPFPEEFNRVAVGKLAQLHFCPTTGARDNLLADGGIRETVHVTGNTVIDALQYTERRLPAFQRESDSPRVLVTAHRRENFGAPMQSIFSAILDLCAEFPRLAFTYPVHPNPNVRELAHRMLDGHPQVRLTAPLNYPDLVGEMRASRFILTDSGGIQEEAPALAVPVLVLRNETERPEAVDAGVARVVGTGRDAIRAECRRLLTDEEHYRSMARGVSPYGDGHAAERIAAIVNDYLAA